MAAAVLWWAVEEGSAAPPDEVPAMLAVAKADVVGPEQCAAIDVRWAGWRELDGPDALNPDGTPRHVWGRGGGCGISLEQPLFEQLDWVVACVLVAHEYGHAVGLPHTIIRGDLMNGQEWPESWQPCAISDPLRPLWLVYDRLEIRIHRITQRCYRREELGWRTRRCWRIVNQLERQQDRIWDQLHNAR
jgi:hypothetical protein